MNHIGTNPKLGFIVYQVKYRFVFLKTSYDILQTPSIAWRDRNFKCFYGKCLCGLIRQEKGCRLIGENVVF
ncbi:MAG: hypothetical protein SRB2_02798 [Desulfobacteraceae bacterium Eth-SRB2]|nr:MAG: hypothetical protein SRB2_02798 [Desulfobacteraceae bacterium Eth-SRB2]